jgi:flagellar biogenesis protein FliO
MVEFRQVAAVVGVLTLLMLTLWSLRKGQIAKVFALKSKPARRLECLERLPLGPHHTLHLVRMGETSLLVASSPGGCSLVQSFPPDVSRGEASR